MARSFDATNAPFDRLTPQQIGAVEAALDVGYFRPGETLIARDGAPELAVRRHQGLRRGARRRRSRRLARPRRLFRQPRPRPGRRIERLRRARGDAVQPRAARPDPQAHRPQRPLRRLLLSRDLAQARSGGARPGGGALQPAARRAGARRAAPSRRLHRADETIESAGETMRANKTNAVFVRDGARVGLLTGMSLARAAILERKPIAASVADLAKYDIVTVEADDFVSRALLRMTKHNKRRVAVVDNGEYVGVLEDIDLLSFIAGNSQMVAARIDRASSRDDLAAAAGAIEVAGAHAAAAGRAGRSRRRDRLRPQPPPVRQAVRHDRFAVDPRTRLPDRHGLGRARRADDAHRPGQRPHPRRAGRRSGAQGVPRRLFRRARALRLSALPGRSDGRQPAMVEAARRLRGRLPPLARRARRDARR